MPKFRPSTQSQSTDVVGQVQYMRQALALIETAANSKEPLPGWVQQRIGAATMELGMAVSYLNRVKGKIS